MIQKIQATEHTNAWVAEQIFESRLSVPGVYTFGDFRAAAFDYAMNDERPRGEFMKQTGEWTMANRGLRQNFVGPAETQPTQREAWFVDQMRQISKEERAGVTAFNVNEFRWLTAQETAEARRERIRAEAAGPADPVQLRGLTNYFFTSPRPDKPLAPSEMKKWEAIARFQASGDPRELKDLFVGGEPGAGGPKWQPSDYHFTSFTGLAEQMQQMWSGVPADAMQASATSLASIDTKMDQLIASVNANGSVINMGPMPANWNDVVVPNAVGGIA